MPSRAAEDRKSTRLNSSHSQISYAVFGLKKKTCDDIWVIDCSPEGHQPDVPTRIFQGVQQPVCIVLASRSAKSRKDTPATVRFQSLPEGRRKEKFAALAKITLGGGAWIECPTDWRAPFLPASTGAWATYPAL